MGGAASALRDVTVIVPAFNAAASIAQTLRSIQAQTHAATAVLVADDASSDDTARIVGEFAALRVETERAWQGIGQVRYGATAAEEKSRAFRRSLYIALDLKAGDVLTDQNVRAVRPGFGLPPKHLEQVLGRRVNRDAPAGTPLAWELLG